MTVRTPLQLVLAFCRRKGICTGCRARWVAADRKKCERCLVSQAKSARAYKRRLKGEYPDFHRTEELKKNASK